mmetsp:Transcript_11965/g.28384  ORF Transcript_11965/g.28384 Transcript_11965/m.28384 type:complete len:203 (+) Transcript_11965:73-681(+)
MVQPSPQAFRVGRGRLPGREGRGGPAGKGGGRGGAQLLPFLRGPSARGALHARGLPAPLHGLERVRQPIEPLVEALPPDRDGSLHVPPAVPHLRQSKGLAHLRRRQASFHVLLVGKDEDCAVSHEWVLDNGLELRGRLLDPVPVHGVDDVDEAVCVVEVVPPEGPQLLLATNVPHREGDVAVLHLLNIEPYCWHGAEDLADV